MRNNITMGNVVFGLKNFIKYSIQFKIMKLETIAQVIKICYSSSSITTRMNTIINYKLPKIFGLFFTFLIFSVFIILPIDVEAGDYCNCSPDDHGYVGEFPIAGRVITDAGAGWVSWQDSNAPQASSCTGGGATLADGGFTSCPSSTGLRVKIVDDCNTADHYVTQSNPQAAWWYSTCDNSNLTVRLENIHPDYKCLPFTIGADTFTPDTNCEVTIPDAQSGWWFKLGLKDILPVGYHEPNPATIPSCEQVTGWTCDGDKFDQPLDVHIYDGATFLAATTASVNREPAVGAQCGGFVNHGFSWVIPDTLKDGVDHNLHVYAINIDQSGTPNWPSSPNPLLTWSPHIINCTPDPWYKLQGASLYKNGAVNNFIPVALQAYDTDDTTDRFLIVRGTNPPRATQEGVVISGSNIYQGGAQVSTNQWRRQNYTRSLGYLGNINSFIEYVKLRKKFVVITSLADMESNTINIFNGNVDIGTTNPGQINGSITNAVLLATGNINLDAPLNTFNPGGNSIALIAAGTININSSVQLINGVLIASQVNLSSDVNPSTRELKINGNLITTNDLDSPLLKRDRTIWQRPSLFVVFNPNMYVNLMTHLSTIIQEGRQLQ